jgi:hypothetical protein
VRRRVAVSPTPVASPCHRGRGVRSVNSPDFTELLAQNPPQRTLQRLVRAAYVIA